MEKQFKIIHNRRIALNLSRLGFPILDIVGHRRKKHVDVYVFENTKCFEECFTSILESRNVV
jgi:hypothetical protein